MNLDASMNAYRLKSPRPPQFTMLLFVYQDISLHYCTTLTGFIAHRLREKT